MTQKPTLWRDMTREEKGALLLTFDTIDGKPDPASIKIEEVTQ